MKAITLILSFTILFLAIKPGIEQIFLKAGTSQNCCGGVPIDNSKEENKKEDCEQSTCNPFFDCNSCSIVYLIVEDNFILKPITHYRNFSILTPSPISHFTPDFWQPPKSV